MRTIPVQTVAEKVSQAVQEVNFITPDVLMQRLREIHDHEPSAAGQLAMIDILENRAIAAEQRVPMCQDTGMILIFAEVGQEIHFTGGSLTEAICDGVRRGCKEGFLRNSVVKEPLFERHNSRDNTPPVIHYEIVPGDLLKLTVAAKGFGAENMSCLMMLTPAQGITEVKRRVVQCVLEAGPNACPPIVVGVGVGGTMEKAALLAKKALLREMGQRNPDARYAHLEEELLSLVNTTGVGPQGWGGRNTAIDVRVECYPTHIAGLPLAINLDCHLNRHITIVVE